MLELLRDPIWQFAGALLALIAIALSIYLFALQRHKKSLSYRVLTETQLLTVDEAIRSKLQIVYSGVPIQNVHLLVLKIINDGNLAITSGDFVEPLSFEFGQDTNILSAEIIDLIHR